MYNACHYDVWYPPSTENLTVPSQDSSSESSKSSKCKSLIGRGMPSRHDKVKVRMQQLHVKIQCHPFPWVCKIFLECIIQLQMVQDIGASSSDLTLSPLWNSVRVLNLLSCIHHAIVCTGIVVQMLLCSSCVINGVFWQLIQCHRVTFGAVWFVVQEDWMKTCWGRIQIQGM